MNPFRRTLLLVFLAWAVIVAIYFGASHDLLHAIPKSTAAFVQLAGIVAAVLFVAFVPWQLQRFASEAMARRQRLEVLGYWIYDVYHSQNPDGFEFRWQSYAAGGSDRTIYLGATDDADLVPRLIRTLRAGPIVSVLSLFVALLVAVTVQVRWPGGFARDVALTITLGYVVSTLYVLYFAGRDSGRSVHTITRALVRDEEYAESEMAQAMLGGYWFHNVRPRDQDPRWLAEIASFVAIEPTAHFDRYHLFRFLFDTGQTEALEHQRTTILSLDRYLRAAGPDVSAMLVIWYAAYLSSTSEELKRVWAWVEEPEPGLELAELWLSARSHQLRGNVSLARSKAVRARDGYRAADPQGYAFEIDHIERLMTSLPNVDELASDPDDDESERVNKDESGEES